MDIIQGKKMQNLVLVIQSFLFLRSSLKQAGVTQITIQF